MNYQKKKFIIYFYSEQSLSIQPHDMLGNINILITITHYSIWLSIIYSKSTKYTCMIDFLIHFYSPGDWWNWMIFRTKYGYIQVKIFFLFVVNYYALSCRWLNTFIIHRISRSIPHLNNVLKTNRVNQVANKHFIFFLNHTCLITRHSITRTACSDISS